MTGILENLPPLFLSLSPVPRPLCSSLSPHLSLFYVFLFLLPVCLLVSFLMSHSLFLPPLSLSLSLFVLVRVSRRPSDFLHISSAFGPGRRRRKGTDFKKGAQKFHIYPRVEFRIFSSPTEAYDWSEFSTSIFRTRISLR